MPSCYSGVSCERPFCPFSLQPGQGDRKLFLCRRGLHRGEDPHDFCLLGRRDVLGHVDDGVHGDLWIGLYQTRGRGGVRFEIVKKRGRQQCLD